MLEERILRDIGDLFVHIRFFAYSKDEIMLKNDLPKIEEKRTLINHFGTSFQISIFNYCFDNLKILIGECQYEFIGDFADAIHNLPEIFYQDYNLKRYWKIYIEPLRKKHGKQLFIDFKQIFKGMNNNIKNNL